KATSWCRSRGSRTRNPSRRRRPAAAARRPHSSDAAGGDVGSHLDKITADMKAAMKSGDKARLEVLRMLISDLKKKAIDAQVDALPEADEVAILQKAVKTRQDSVAQAKAGGRTDIASREQAEIEVINGYLPRQLSAGEVAALVKALAQEL